MTNCSWTETAGIALLFIVAVMCWAYSWGLL